MSHKLAHILKHTLSICSHMNQISMMSFTAVCWLCGSMLLLLYCRHDLDAEQAVGLCTEEHWGGVIAGRYPGALQTHNKPRNHSSMSAANLSGGNPSNSHLWGFLRQRQQQQQGPPQQAGVLQQMHHRSHHSFTEGAAGAAVSIAGSAKSGKSGNGGKSLMKRSLSRRFKTSTNHACCIRHLPYMDRPMLVLAW